MKRVE